MGIVHYLLGKPGHPLARASYVFATSLTLFLLKLLKTKYKYLEQYTPFIVTSIIQIGLTEQSLFLYPSEYKLHARYLIMVHIQFSVIFFISFQEYFNVLVFMQKTQKRMLNRVIWGYYVLRSFLFYGHFPIDVLMTLVVMTVLQDSASVLRDKYSRSIKRQHDMVSNFLHLSLYRSIAHTVAHLI